MLGSGGVGGTFGARLVQAGHDVIFLARGAHAAALRERGLRLESERGNLQLDFVQVHEEPGAVGPVELVVMAVKLRDSEAAARSIAPLVGPATAVVSLQNGVEKDELLAATVGREHVLGGVTYLAAVVAEPGRIVQTGRLQRVLLGELDGGSSARCAAAVEAFAGAGIEARASDDIRRATWEKFVFLTSIAGLTALTRQPVGPLRAHPATRALLLDALREVVALARAEGVAVDEDFAERQLTFIDALAPTTTSSMAQDLLRGRPLELEWLNGTVVRRAVARGLATPVHRAIHAGLVLHADGAPSPRS